MTTYGTNGMVVPLPNSQDDASRTQRRDHQQSASRLRGTSRNGPRPPFIFVSHQLPPWVKSQTRLFADDCLLYREIKSQNDHTILQQDLKNLETWANTCGMRFNAKKCYLLSTRRKFHHFYSLNSTNLQQVPSNPYLGVTISEDLKWGPHITKMTKRQTPPSDTWEETCEHALYQVNVAQMSHWWLVAWDPHYQTDINTIERVQHRAGSQIHHRRLPLKRSRLRYKDAKWPQSTTPRGTMPKNQTVILL